MHCLRPVRIGVPRAPYRSLEQRDEKTRRKELTNFTYDLSRCMFCGLCEDACPTDALELTQDFELANYTREGAIWDRETLERAPSQPSTRSKKQSSTARGTRRTTSHH